MKITKLTPVVVIILLSGCATAQEITVDSYVAKYVMRSSIGTVIGDDVNLPLVQDWTSGDFVVIEIVTAQDLLSLVKDSGASLFPDIRFCDLPDAPVLLGIPEVYSGGTSITSLRLDDQATAVEPNRASGGDHRYDVVLFLGWDAEREVPDSLKSTNSYDYYLKYDLRTNPEDVCLYLRGSNIVRNLKSNQVRLTKEDLQRIFD